MAKHQPPKDGLVRASRPSLEIRAESDGGMPKLTGYAARFDENTDIDSLFEGRFKERIAPGAFKKTLKENSANQRLMFNHGHDPSIGEKPLGEPRFVEDDVGLRYDEPELFDTPYVRELLPALESGQFGSSFKFRVVKESYDEEPAPSDSNPEGIAERVLEEVQLYEAGPVVFPAYEGATAGAARSMSLTDREFVLRAKAEPSKVPELVELFTEWVREDPDRIRGLLDDDETSTDGAEATHSTDDEPDAGERTADDVDAPDEGRDANAGAGEDHSVATTDKSDDTDWWRSLSDNNKEWELP